MNPTTSTDAPAPLRNAYSLGNSAAGARLSRRARVWLPVFRGMQEAHDAGAREFVLPAHAGAGMSRVEVERERRNFYNGRAALESLCDSGMAGEDLQALGALVARVHVVPESEDGGRTWRVVFRLPATGNQGKPTTLCVAKTHPEPPKAVQAPQSGAKAAQPATQSVASRQMPAAPSALTGAAGQVAGGRRRTPAA